MAKKKEIKGTTIRFEDSYKEKIGFIKDVLELSTMAEVLRRAIDKLYEIAQDIKSLKGKKNERKNFSEIN